MQMQFHYKSQRDIMIGALKTHMPVHIANYNIPTAGMFIWVEFLENNKKNPNEEQSSSSLMPSFEIFKYLAGKGIIAVPGGDFRVSPSTCDINNAVEGEVKQQQSEEIVDPSIVRLTFAAASPVQIQTGIERLAVAMTSLVDNN